MSGWRGTAGVALGAALASLAMAAPAAAASPRPTAHAATRARPVVMILMDTHGAEYGRRLLLERQAAVAYLAALPVGVRAGLITFSTSWRLVLAPTPDRGRMVRAVGAVHAGRPASTATYRAIAEAESVIERLRAPASRLVVLSNAEEIPSRGLKSGIPIDVILWRFDADDNAGELRALAGASGGHVADAAQAAWLAGVFRPAVTVSPAGLPGAAKPWLLATGLAGVFAGLLLAALMLVRPLAARGPRRLARQLERYGPRHASAAEPGPQAPATEAHEAENAAHAAIGLAAGMLRSTHTEQRLARRLEWAGIARPPAEWALLTACAVAVCAALLAAAARNPLLGVPAGALVGWLAMRLVVSVRIGRRRAAFSEQLPEVLQLIASSLQSGFSLAQALDAVVREESQPAAGEFARALAEARIGANLEDAMDRVADRTASTDLRLTVMAIRIQREVGGNLAEVLRTTVATMRERAFLRRQIKALSAEGRLSSYILIALPLLVGAWFFYVDPNYMSRLYTTAPGLAMFAGSALLMVAGVVWMRKLIHIEV
jgi:tight adherence protein B